MAWLDLIADGRAGHGSFRNDDNAVTALAAAVARIGDVRVAAPDHRRPAGVPGRGLGGVRDRARPGRSRGDRWSRLGSIARMVGATMSNTANPTMLQAGYKHNVIPGEATGGDRRPVRARWPGRVLATITELLGEKVRYEVVTDHAAVETEFAGSLVEAMQACLVGRGSGSPRGAVPDERRHRREGLGPGSASAASVSSPLRLPPDLDFVSLFHGVDERVPIESLAVRRPGARPVPRPGLTIAAGADPLWTATATVVDTGPTP